MQKNKDIKKKIFWSFALFSNVILTILFIYAQSIPGCILVILIGLLISRYGDPIIFENYNKKRDLKYEKAIQKRSELSSERKR
ncbi:hypothetical protein [Ligilactobacillus pobuzihii]|uniref:hypothetical protein n=1 Tax=Ligilactobacillus pobuzihii TaxID=449659 RepID=UPI000369F2FA|nr:hypothetical protein [Ligilactobacillus pobuzihii]GEN48775.1 hypothetical protein LPO01_15670 [Ligilactobacillus pobuzihii]